jgi:DNA-binding transcriptional MocR family regulator
MSSEVDLEKLLFDAKEPRYLMLAREIVREIRSGAYPVGALLPAESELSVRIGVSRFTVREAIRKLTEAGLTRVEAAESQARYVQYIVRSRIFGNMSPIRACTSSKGRRRGHRSPMPIFRTSAKTGRPSKAIATGKLWRTGSAGPESSSIRSTPRHRIGDRQRH